MLSMHFNNTLIVFVSYIIIVYSTLIGSRAIVALKLPCDDEKLQPLNSAFILFLMSAIGFCLIFFTFVSVGLVLGISTWSFTIALIVLGVFAFAGMSGVYLVIQKVISSPQVILLFTVFYIAFAIGSIKPPGSFDDTMYQLPYALSFLNNGGFQVNEWIRFPLFPANLNLAFAACLSFGSVELAQLLASSIPFSLILLGIYGIAKHLKLNSVFCMLAVIITYKKNDVAGTYGYAYVDIFLMYIALGAAAMLLCSKFSIIKNDIKSLFLAGCLAGTAAGIKLFGLVYTASLFAGLLLSGVKFKRIIYYVAGVILFGIFWYARSFYFSGDPFHPTGGRIFGYYIWDAEDLAAHIAENKSHMLGVHSIENFMRILKDNWGGVLLLSLIPPYYNWKKLNFIWFAIIIYLCVWYAFTPVVRYLAPIYPIAIIVVFAHANYLFNNVAKSINYNLSKNIQKFVSNSWNVMIVVGLLGYTTIQILKYYERIVNWETIQQSVSGYRVMTYANTVNHSTYSRVLQIGFENAIFFYSGQALGDFHGPARYRQFYRCEGEQCSLIPSDEMKLKMGKLNVDTLLINKNRFNFDRSEYQRNFYIQEISPSEFYLKLRD